MERGQKEVHQEAHTPAITKFRTTQMKYFNRFFNSENELSNKSATFEEAGFRDTHYAQNSVKSST